MLKKIISGGQTGVDRAALDAALGEGFPCGGWCPAGRKAEDGVIGQEYPMAETKSSEYEPRTEKNVIDSDGTLILTEGEPEGGTALTVYFARKHKKPCMIIDFSAGGESADDIACWIKTNRIEVLNVAGPRNSKNRGIYSRAKTLVEDVIGKFKQACLF